MPVARWVLHGLFVVGAALSTGCGIVDPCDFGWDVGMTGTWELTRVNGDPIPSVGYPLPASSDRLSAGILRFKTLKVGRCEDPGDVRSEGRVVAVYSLVNAAGQPKPTKAYAGTFLYNNTTGIVTLKAFNKSLDGDRLGEEFNVRPDIPLFGTYTLTFERVSLE